MAKKADLDGETPGQVASVPPPQNINSRTGEVNLVVQSIQNDIKNIKSELSEAKSDRHSNRHNDFMWNVGMFATGFILLGGMLIFGYFRLEDSINKVDESGRRIEILVTRIDARLDSLQQRLSSPQAPSTANVPTK